jgi:hypothetical protein
VEYGHSNKKPEDSEGSAHFSGNQSTIFNRIFPQKSLYAHEGGT